MVVVSKAAAAYLQTLRQVPVIERDIWCNVGCQEGISQVAIEVQALLIHLQACNALRVKKGKKQNCSFLKMCPARKCDGRHIEPNEKATVYKGLQHWADSYSCVGAMMFVMQHKTA